MKILPVIDLMDGVVVRGVAGRRNEYRPVESCLAENADPVTIARGFRNQLGLDELYVADLDAIEHQRPNTPVYRKLADDGFQMMVDGGIQDVPLARETFAAGATAVIVGLETSPSFSFLRELCREFGTERVLFSLDLHDGKPMGRLTPSTTTDALQIAMEAVEAGCRRIIVLDLAGVGLDAGVSTERLCRRLLEDVPDLNLITGGGVRTVDDLLSLKTLGLEGVLVASALHTGAIGRQELEQLRRSQADE